MCAALTREGGKEQQFAQADRQAKRTCMVRARRFGGGGPYPLAARPAPECAFVRRRDRVRPVRVESGAPWRLLECRVAALSPWRHANARLPGVLGPPTPDPHELWATGADRAVRANHSYRMARLRNRVGARGRTFREDKRWPMRHL